MIALSIELRRQRRAVAGPADRDAAQHPVGQRYRSDARDLVARVGDCVAGGTSSHLGHLRRFIPRARLGAGGVDRRAVGDGGGPHHRSDVSAVHVLHGDRPEDNGSLTPRAGDRGVHRRPRRDGAASGARDIRAVLRAVHRRSDRDAHRRTVSFSRSSGTRQTPPAANAIFQRAMPNTEAPAAMAARTAATRAPTTRRTVTWAFAACAARPTPPDRPRP